MLVDTIAVVKAKFAVVEPAGIVTEAGTDPTEGLLLVNAMVSPPEGAAEVMRVRSGNRLATRVLSDTGDSGGQADV